MSRGCTRSCFDLSSACRSNEVDPLIKSSELPSKIFSRSVLDYKHKHCTRKSNYDEIFVRQEFCLRDEMTVGYMINTNLMKDKSDEGKITRKQEILTPVFSKTSNINLNGATKFLHFIGISVRDFPDRG